MTPWEASRWALASARAWPRLRRISMAFSTLPWLSARALLHSIMPIPVRSRRSLTISAVIAMILSPWTAGGSGGVLVFGLGRLGRLGLLGQELLADPVLLALDDGLGDLGHEQLDGP